MILLFRALWLALIFSASPSQAISDFYSKNIVNQITSNGMIDPDQINISDDEIVQLESDAKSILNLSILKSVKDAEQDKKNKGDPEFDKAKKPGSVQAVLDGVWSSFKLIFNKFRHSHPGGLNEKNSVVYVIGGSMEYLYFLGRVHGIPQFMTPDQFKFLAASRNIFTGEGPGPDYVKYIEKLLQQDLIDEKDIILIDSVNRGLSLAGTYHLVNDCIRKLNSKSRVINFGIPEQGKGLRHKSGGNNGFISGATNSDEYLKDLSEMGWAYYEFSESKNVVKVQSVPRMSTGKFTDQIKDHFPIAMNGMPDDLSQLLKEKRMSEIIKMIKEYELDWNYAYFLFNRLRALVFYQRAKNLTRQADVRKKKISCDALF